MTHFWSFEIRLCRKKLFNFTNRRRPNSSLLLLLLHKLETAIILFFFLVGMKFYDTLRTREDILSNCCLVPRSINRYCNRCLQIYLRRWSNVEVADFIAQSNNTTFTFEKCRSFLKKSQSHIIAYYFYWTLLNQ